MYGGATFQELTHEKAIACAEHFYKAHVETTAHNARLLPRMEKMELALTKDQIKQLDWWLSLHPHDVPKGALRYPDWTMFELTDRGYQPKSVSSAVGADRF